MDRSLKDLFSGYGAHYGRMTVIERLQDDLDRLRRDRLPHWITEIPREARILDLGCGKGHLLAALFRLGYRNLQGVDLSPQMIRGARKILPPSVQIFETDISEFLDCTDSDRFDVVFVYDLLEHLPRQETIPVLQKVHRVLKTGGRLSIRVPKMASLIAGYTSSIDFTHITHFTEWSLIQVLEASNFSAENVVFESQSPRLFWSWRRPHRMVFRLLNRLWWHLNNVMHRMLYFLSDMHPRPTIYDFNILAIAYK